MTGIHLLVGGSGPIGRAVRRLAEEAEFGVTWTARSDEGAPIMLDVEDPESVQQALSRARFDSILYLARHGELELEPSQALTRFIEATIGLGIRRIVYASSAAVYGTRSRNPHRESDPLDPITPYANAKTHAEIALRKAAGIDTVALRIFNVYGPGLHASLINRMFMDAGEAPEVYDSAEFVRDYVHVDDVARAILRAAVAELPEHSELNIGSGIGTTNIDLLSKPGARAKRMPLPEPSWSIADPTAADRVLGDWRTIRLADAIAGLTARA